MFAVHRPGARIHPLRTRLHALFLRGDWPARLVSALGWRPRVRVRRYQVRLPGLPAHAPPLRIAYASDFHAGPFTHPDALVQACEALCALRPDVLLLGGDFVDSDAARIDALAPLLERVPASLGRYAVLGNHEWWTDAKRVERRLAGSGIELLTNRNVPLPSPFAHVRICGLDDPLCGRPDPEAAFTGADGVRILLAHSPAALVTVGERHFDLALCGHTHGGQIALPGGRPIVVPAGALTRRYAYGPYDLGGGRTLIVSRGVGCSGLPLRVFADPEVLLCEVPPGPGA